MNNNATSPHTLVDDPQLRQQVIEFLNIVEAENGIAPFSEQFMLGLSDARLGHEHFLSFSEGRLIGVLALDRAAAVPVAEVAVKADGVEVADSLISGLGTTVDVWSHGVGAVGRLEGAQTVRELLVMALDKRVESPMVPEHLTVLNLAESRVRWGEFVDAEFLRVNNEAFDWHPEQGHWDQSRWERAQEAEWFDPAGVLLLWSGVDVEGSTTLQGFHWTKCVKSQPVNDTRILGEVYVVALSDAARGQGLGKVITLLGVDYLQKNGSEQVILYVEADNAAAVTVYERLGFAVKESHVLYRFSN
ncbi:mycothiol synthase [Corynebacterium sp. H130]|uniref:mycothiol synthase n=1 Tax=Corynebacterium sp. H130 TaxID=3133444 RepID=UPI0030A61923